MTVAENMQDQSGRSSEELQSEMQALKDDLRKVQSDLQQITHSVVGWSRESYEQARETAGKRFETGVDQMEQYVQQRPITTILVTFGIGLVAGTLFRR